MILATAARSLVAERHILDFPCLVSAACSPPVLDKGEAEALKESSTCLDAFPRVAPAADATFEIPAARKGQIVGPVEELPMSSGNVRGQADNA